VLKIENWLAQNLCRILEIERPDSVEDSLYQIDMSSKNARWKRKIYLSEQLKSLHS